MKSFSSVELTLVVDEPNSGISKSETMKYGRQRNHGRERNMADKGTTIDNETMVDKGPR